MASLLVHLFTDRDAAERLGNEIAVVIGHDLGFAIGTSEDYEVEALEIQWRIERPGMTPHGLAGHQLTYVFKSLPEAREAQLQVQAFLTNLGTDSHIPEIPWATSMVPDGEGDNDE